MAPGKTKSVRTVKKLSGGKRNKWKKGQSSSSNPNTFNHRERAKQGLGFLGVGSAKRKGLANSLTEESLKKHLTLEAEAEDDAMSGEFDTASQASSGATFKTWASGFTNCTNVSFKRVMLFSSGDSEMQKEILAILAAVTEVIKSEGGKETETEYFAALLTVIDFLPTDQIDSLTAASYLLSLVLKRVSEGVLRKKFSETTRILLKVLAQVCSDPPTSLSKSVIRCLARLLRVPEVAVWKESSSMQVFQSILAFTISDKPKIRTAAQVGVCSILRGSSIMLAPDPPASHPAAAIVAKFAVHQIEESGGQRTSLATLLMLELLKEVLSLFPLACLKSVCETLLRIMTLGNLLIITKAFDVLHLMFKSGPKSVTPELNAQLITAMYDYQPHLKDAQPCMAWCTVMQYAHSNLFKLDPFLCLSHLSKLFTTCLSFFLVNDEQLIKTGKSVIINLFETCVKGIEGDVKKIIVAQISDQKTSPLHRLFTAVETCLNFQFHSVWEHSLEVVGKAFQFLGPFFKFTDSPVFRVIKSLGDLRETPTFSLKSNLDATVGLAVKAVGPEFVLQAIPLMITGLDTDRLDFPRSWLLPVLRDHIESTELSFFIKYFLPLSSKLWNRSRAKQQEQQIADAKTYEVLQHQIWSLLPGFCSYATDVTQSFKSIAKTLGVLLQERQDIRNELMSSLRNLVIKAKDEESKLEVKRFSKNYLPILFNLYTSDQEIGSSPLAVLETIRVFLTLSDADLIQNFVEKLFPKLAEDGITVARKLKLLDITVAMTPYMNEFSIAKTYDLVMDYLKTSDKGVQKKCYRILEYLCGGGSDFLKSHMDDLCKILASSLSMAGPSAKAPRLRSLTHLIGTFEKPRQDFVQKLIPEAVLCCTESTAVRARQAALLFLSKATEKMILWNHPDKTKSQVLAELLEFLCAGFAGSTASIISAIAAITHLLKEHTAFIEQTTRGKLFEMSLVLLQSSNRQVLTHVLALSKLLLKKSSIRDFGNFTRELASILGKFPELEKKACRKTIRLILVIALKNLGIEILHKMVPDCFKKVVMNLHKKNLKKASKPPKDDIESDEEDETPRLKAESFEDMLGDDSDVETAEEDKKKQRPRLKAKRTKGKEAWLEERGKEEEIVDLLDPSAAQKVIATKPNNPATNKSGIKHDFKMAADGKMIITDGEQPVAKKQEVKLEMNELLDALEGAASVGKKRKVRVREADDSDEEVETSPKKYTAGGKGIHRPTGIEMGGEYRSKKARGDMKRKGKQDPYAYIPLDAKSLNKRKVKKLQGRFKNVVGAAKKGAMKGKKLKAKNKKK